jgi:hypothetical protein
MGEKKSRFKCLAVFILAFFIIWTLRATVFYSVDLSFAAGLERKIYSESIKFLLWTVPVFVFLTFVDKTDPLAFLKLNTKIEFKKGIFPTAILVGYFVLTLVFEHYAHQRNFDLSPGPIGLLGALGGVSISPISEEILFRGFILGKLCQTTSFAWANVITSILFVAVHLPNWFWVNGYQPWIPIVSANIFILSLMLGWLVKRSNSLYPAISGHIINNFISAGLRP